MMKELIGKKMPKKTICIDNSDLKDKSGEFHYEMQSEYEFEENFERIERAENWKQKNSAESDESVDDNDEYELRASDELVSATIFLTVYSDEDGNLFDYDVSKCVDYGERGRSEVPEEREIDDVLALFLSEYDDD